MKNRILYALLFLLLGMQFNAFAQADPGSALSYLDINNVKFGIFNGGDWGWDLSTTSINEMPKGSGKSTIFAGGLWIGGLDNGNLHMAAMTYRQNGSDFFPGPLDITNAGTSKADCKNYNNIWGAHKKNIDDFRSGVAAPGYGVKLWPGNTIPSVSGNKFSSIMAPYVDMNKNLTYDIDTANPGASDYPLIKGDQALWWIMNDNGNVHGETNGTPLGVEVRGSVYGFNCTLDTALNNTVFFEYEIINRSNKTYDSLYIGNWIDFDIGYGFDDYIGTDTLLSAFYAYNGAATDKVYKNNPPVEAVVFLDAPMSNTMYYNNDLTPIGNPEQARHYYNFLRSTWKNGTHLRADGKTGTNDSFPSTNYVFPGYPDSAGTKGWTERNAGNAPGDRRMLGSSGPYKFKAGEHKTISFACVFTQLPNGNNLTNLAQMRKDVAHIRNLYNAGITTACSTTGIEDAKISFDNFKIYPNPALNQFSLEIEKAGNYSVRMINVLGQDILSKNVQGLGKTDFSLQGVPAGVYSLILQSGNSVGVKKLIVE